MQVKDKTNTETATLSSSVRSEQVHGLSVCEQSLLTGVQWINTKKQSLRLLKSFFGFVSFPMWGLQRVTFWRLRMRIALTCWWIFDPTWLVCTAPARYIWPNIWNGKLEIHSLQIWRFLSWNLLKYIKHKFWHLPKFHLNLLVLPTLPKTGQSPPYTCIGIIENKHKLKIDCISSIKVNIEDTIYAIFLFVTNFWWWDFYKYD